MAHWTRDDSIGKWHRRVISPIPPWWVPSPGHALPPVGNFLPSHIASVVSSLVVVQFSMPYLVDGIHESRFTGTGIPLTILSILSILSILTILRNHHECRTGSGCGRPEYGS